LDNLGKIPIFHGFTADEYQHLAKIVQSKDYVAGELVLRQGQTSRNVWVMLEGRCEVVKSTGDGPHESLVLAMLEPYSHFGEMSFFNPAPHSANVRAQSDVKLLCLAHADYQKLLERGDSVASKFSANVAHSLSDRLRRMDEWVVELSHPHSPNEKVPEWSSFRDRLFNRWDL
jgi:CRP-like cAMP-binding protein